MNSDGTFAFRCTEALEGYPAPDRVLARRGWVGFHHCLTLHSSAPKTNDRDRRIFVLQYRATDAVQLAGVIWKCNGYQVDPRETAQQMARFPDGTRIPLRGEHGRLYDLYATLKPNTPPKSY